MIKGIAFAETKFVPLEKAVVPVTDIAVQRGTGFFETLCTYDKVPFLLDERIARLLRSAKYMGLRQAPSARFIRAKVFAGLKKFKYREALIKIILTGGDSGGLVPEGRARLYILLMPFVPWPRAAYARGIKIYTGKYSRTLPELKSIGYLSAVLAQQRAERAGYDEALYLDQENHILEGTTFNIGLVKKNRLIVPEDGILEGFTMKIVMRLAQKRRLPVVRRLVKYAELRSADEVFITSASREVIPVRKIDRITVGKGVPGPWSRLLLADYRNYAQRNKN